MVDLADRIERAARRLAGRRVVVLPDFFLDHFVPLVDYDGFKAGADGVRARGGGNLLTGGQSLRIGGNAANTAFALGRLGVATTLVTHTDAFGARILAEGFAGLPVDLSCVTIGDRMSATVALEFHEDASNVMLSDPGPLRTLTVDDLDTDGTGRVWAAIEAADAVAVTNWAQTVAGGTEILRAVTRRARAAGTFTFLDTGDPTHRGDDAAARLLDGDALATVDAWGMNENELRHFARVVRDDADDLHAAAAAVRTRYGGRLDVHTWSEVFTTGPHGAARSGAYVCEPLRLTGSGDAWNAGNLLGQLLGLEDAARLTVANAVAAITITGTAGTPPDLPTLVHFLRRPPYALRPLA